MGHLMVDASDWLIAIVSGATGIFGACLGAWITMRAQAKSEKTKRTIDVINYVGSNEFIQSKSAFLTILHNVRSAHGSASEDNLKSYASIVRKAFSEEKSLALTLRYSEFEEYMLGLCGLIKADLLDNVLISKQIGGMFGDIKETFMALYSENPEYNAWKISQISALDRITPKAEQSSKSDNPEGA